MSVFVYSLKYLLVETMRQGVVLELSLSDVKMTRVGVGITLVRVELME